MAHHREPANGQGRVYVYLVNGRFGTLELRLAFGLRAGPAAST